MPTGELLSAAQCSRLTALAEMDARGLAHHRTLSDADLTAVSIRRGAANRLGFTVQICLLRFPGRPLRAGEAVPRNVIEFVASQVGADPGVSTDLGELL